MKSFRKFAARLQSYTSNFQDAALEANTSVTGGQTVMNPWCTIGGVATTVCQSNEFIV